MRLAAVQLPVQACGNTFSGEPDAGKSACPVRRGESGSHHKVSPSLLLYREILPFEFLNSTLRADHPLRLTQIVPLIV